MNLVKNDQFTATNKKGIESFWQVSNVINDGFQTLYVLDAIGNTIEQCQKKVEELQKKNPFLPKESFNVKNFSHIKVDEDWFKDYHIEIKKQVFAIYDDGEWVERNLIAITDLEHLKEIFSQIKNVRHYSDEMAGMYLRVEKYVLNRYK